jgi:hypothetical protein
MKFLVLTIVAIEREQSGEKDEIDYGELWNSLSDLDKTTIKQVHFREEIVHQTHNSLFR